MYYSKFLFKSMLLADRHRRGQLVSDFIGELIATSFFFLFLLAILEGLWVLGGKSQPPIVFTCIISYFFSNLCQRTAGNEVHLEVVPATNFSAVVSKQLGEPRTLTKQIGTYRYLVE